VRLAIVLQPTHAFALIKHSLTKSEIALPVLAAMRPRPIIIPIKRIVSCTEVIIFLLAKVSLLRAPA
jgi:hypothetical protein